MLKDYTILCTQYLLPKRLLTILIGLFADLRLPWLKNFLIRHFIRAYRVNMSEACHPAPEDYPTFNDFFIRHLLPDARPPAKATLLCPVDGAISELGPIRQGKLLQAKGKHYTLQSLIQSDAEEAALWEGGQFMTLYLAPKDYHRIHMPLTGTVTKMHYVPGKLFSVQPATTRTIPRLFSQNERVVVHFNTTEGELIMVLVGATIVGKIATAWHGEFQRSRTATCTTYSPACPLTLAQFDEMGYFKLGSTVILLLSPHCSVRWRASLKATAPVRLGEALS